MSYENFSVEELAATFEELSAKRADGFSAEESKSEKFAVSYDAGSSSGSSYSDTDYGNYYTSGANVYVYGSADSQISLFMGTYGTVFNIDATSSSGVNRLAGNSYANIILGGTGVNFMWGIPDYSNDILVGNDTGYDFFVSGKNEGNDTIINASASDTVYLQDVTLSDIAFTASDGYTLGILFNTGNVLTINGTSSAGADIELADGSVYWYGYFTKTWHQTA